MSRPDPTHALLAVQASGVAPITVVCVDRHHRLARLYATKAGVLTELLVRGQRTDVVWLPDEGGLPSAPACRCHQPTVLGFYTEPLNFAAAVLLDGPVNVTEYRLEIRDVGRLPAMLWVDRQRVARGVTLPSQAGLPPLMEHLRRGGRVSLRVQ